jgi:hypothetical protein
MCRLTALSERTDHKSRRRSGSEEQTSGIDLVRILGNSANQVSQSERKAWRLQLTVSFVTLKMAGDLVVKN